MDNTGKSLGEIDRALIEIQNRQDDILRTIQRLDKQDGEALREIAVLLREQARNNLETSRLLNDLSTEFAGLSFRIGELESWRKLFTSTGQSSIDWITESRSEQSRMAYRAIKDGFDDNEFMELIMNVGINPADIKGDSVSERALWLVEYTRRNGTFWNLIKWGKSMRPTSLWPISTGSLGQAL